MNREVWNPQDFVVSEDEAAKFLSLSKSTLRRMGDRGEGPRKLKLSARRVGYRHSALQEFLEKLEGVKQ